jgi:phosphate:Na+ symporter
VENTSKLNEMEISTVINFNREFYTSFKSIILALKDGVLTTKDAAYFDDLPGFIH